MAYVGDELEDEQSQQADGEQPQQAQSTGAAGTSTLAPSQPTSGIAQGASTPKKTPGKFADLGEYLRVNEGQQFGQQLAGKVGEKVSQAGQGLEQAETEFKSRADSAVVRDEGGVLDQLQNDPRQVDVEQFTRLRDASYQGPRTFADAGDLYGRAQGGASAAISQSRAADSEGGRFSLLDTYFGRPSYSGGQKALDNLLVQNDAGSRAAFDTVKQGAEQLRSRAAQTGAQLDAYGRGAEQATLGTRAAARGALGIDDAGMATGGGALGSQMSNIEAQRQARLQSATDQRGQLEQAFASGDYRNLSPELRQMLGLEGLSSLYGADPNQYLSSVGDISAQQAATPEQAERLRALQQLAGMQDDGSWAEDQVGAYDTESLLGFDSQGLRDMAANRQNQYQATLAAPNAATTQIPNNAGVIVPSNYPVLLNKIRGAGETPFALQDSISTLQNMISQTQANNNVTNAQAKAQFIASLQAALAEQQGKLNNLNSQFGFDNQFNW